jgi:tetratricopeptide (TPR) repeat protein
MALDPHAGVDFSDMQCCRLAPSMRRIFDRSSSRRRTLAGPAKALALWVALGLTSCAKIEARDLIRDGNSLYGKGDFITAIEKYDAAEKLEPDGVTLFWNRACAAEAQVLKMKDPEQREQRRKYADMALRDFQTWYDRVEPKTPLPDDTPVGLTCEGKQGVKSIEAKQLQEHRLALLDADERCDDLLTYWDEKHRACPKEEALYTTIARQYDKCGKPEKVDEWYQKRVDDFPESVRAWHALAIRKYEPLFPIDPETSQVNDTLPPSDRIAIANEVVGLLDKATQLDSKFRDAYVWRSMAYTQRSLARMVIEDPELPEEKLENILMREDVMLAWKQQKAVCDLEGTPECPGPSVDSPCCPPPPLSPEEQSEDAEKKKEILAAIEAAKQAPEQDGAKRRRKR